MSENSQLISIVLPLFNEAEVLPRLYKCVVQNMENANCRFEIIFVNDGSSDDSAAICNRLATSDARVIVLHLSRNFGHQAAVQSGLARATGDAVIVMDSDLQDDPSCLSRFVSKWHEGFQVVYAIRTKRKEGVIKRALFYSFYRFLNSISKYPIPMDAGNFGLIDRQVVDQLVQMKELDRFYPGLRHWVGFRQTGIVVERMARYDDQPRVSMMGLFRLAKTAMFSFSSTPLAMFYGLAFLSFVVFCFASAGAVYFKLILGAVVPGWVVVVLLASFFGCQNALGIALLGEYVLRIFDEVRGRPQFIVAKEVNSQKERSQPQVESATLETSLIGEIAEISQAIQQHPRPLLPTMDANLNPATGHSIEQTQ